MEVITPINLPIPLALPWATGRFYGPVFGMPAASTTAYTAATVYFMPTLVPSETLISTIGIEITVGGGANSNVRMAIYGSTEFGLPNDLLFDSGQVSANVTATYVTASVNQYLSAGVYWRAIAFMPDSANITTRHNNGNTWAVLSNATLGTVSNIAFSGMSLANVEPGGIVTIGFPSLVSRLGMTITINDNIPRVLLGV